LLRNQSNAIGGWLPSLTWKGWNFRFLDKSENEIGAITKKWAGIGKELFTSADNYMIALNQEPEPAKAILLLAAGLAVDVIYKETQLENPPVGVFCTGA
jgi:hypothetical protein